MVEFDIPKIFVNIKLNKHGCLKNKWKISKLNK